MIDDMPEPQLRKMIISELLVRWPQTAKVFQKHNMACVGCVVAPFYTIVEAANVYGLSADKLIEELTAAINEDPQS